MLKNHFSSNLIDCFTRRYKKKETKGRNYLLREGDFRKRFQGRFDAIGIGQDAVTARSSQSLRFLIQLVDALVSGINRSWQVLRRPDREIPRRVTC